jgi:hypothetical protein
LQTKPLQSIVNGGSISWAYEQLGDSTEVVRGDLGGREVEIRVAPAAVTWTDGDGVPQEPEALPENEVALLADLEQENQVLTEEDLDALIERLIDALDV